MKWLNFDKCLKKSSKPYFLTSLSYRCYQQNVILSLLELPILSKMYAPIPKTLQKGGVRGYSRRASVLTLALLGRNTLASITTFTLSISVNINTSVKNQMCSGPIQKHQCWSSIWTQLKSNGYFYNCFRTISYRQPL